MQNYVKVISEWEIRWIMPSFVLPPILFNVLFEQEEIKQEVNADDFEEEETGEEDADDGYICFTLFSGAF